MFHDSSPDQTKCLGLRIRIEKKSAYLQELEEQDIGLQNLIQPNEQLYRTGNAPNGGVSLPFILVQVHYIISLSPVFLVILSTRNCCSVFPSIFNLLFINLSVSSPNSLVSIYLLIRWLEIEITFNLLLLDADFLSSFLVKFIRNVLSPVYLTFFRICQLKINVVAIFISYISGIYLFTLSSFTLLRFSYQYGC